MAFSSTRYVGFAAAALAVALLPGSIGAEGSKNFLPDVVFKGSSLTGWHPLGSAEWRAANGEITGNPKAGGGWLVLDRPYQDVAFFASFRCAEGCKAGILLRAEKTADGGMKGVYVSLADGDLNSYRVTLDAKGVETSRERLRPAGGGQVRVAPPPTPPPANAPAAAPGGRGAPAGRGGGGGFAPLQMPGGIAAPIPRPETSLRANDWNSIEVVLDANILRPFLNDAGGVTGGVADDEFGRFGPFALYAGGSGEVRFKDVSYKDLQPRVAMAEEVSKRFRMQTLNEFYYSWGPAVADFNHDGTPDIVAGPYYYLGPDYNVAREIYMAQTIDASTKYFNGLQYAYDFTGDGWPDVVNVLFTQPITLFVNPKGESRRWDAFVVSDNISSEIGLLKDVDGDGKMELLFKDGNNQIVLANPDPANPTGMWIKRPVTERGPWANHGMGVGDINSDGRMDVLNAYGWWEQPAKGSSAAWTYHPEAWGRWNRSSPGGAEIAVYDVNGDNLPDVVTSLQAHGWGLSWFEQKRADGKISFVEHPIMGDFSTKNAGNVTFSELHGSTFADIDGDGIPDFITGKRFWSHLDTWIDPDPHGAPVLYVYRTVRNPKAPGGAEFVPELIHNRSGMGSHAAVVDLNKDGAPEIITSTKRGTFIFWNQWKKPATGTSSASR
jgi:3-keto-disaccharide hydrolase/VCBS repeat protein